MAAHVLLGGVGISVEYRRRHGLVFPLDSGPVGRRIVAGLEPGDQVDIDIDGVGVLTNTVVAADRS